MKKDKSCLEPPTLWTILRGSNDASVHTYLGAHSSAVHDGVAAVQLVDVINILESLLCGFISRVYDPPAHLHKRPELARCLPNATSKQAMTKS